MNEADFNSENSEDNSLKITLDTFVPRPYQIPISKAFHDDKYRRLFILMPRRSGKDILAFNTIMLPEIFQHIGTYYYIFPTYSQAKKAIWDGITIEGKQMLDYIPKETVVSKNSQELKIKFINGSILQFIGADNCDSLRGTNPRGVIFSEYASQKHPEVWDKIILPILGANKGWAVFLSTPRGKNHFYDLYQTALKLPFWFVYSLTLDDTKHIDEDEMNNIRIVSPEDTILQEYYCSFEAGAEGAYYAKDIDKMHKDKRITQVPWDPAHKVHTAWDLGINNPTCVIYFQEVGKAIHIIDYLQISGSSIPIIAKEVLSKPYLYGYHFPPHDIMVTSDQTGLTRREAYYDLGIDFSDAYNIPVDDGIEQVKLNLPKMWIDKIKCATLIKALENYRQEWDSRRGRYRNKPLHDKYSDGADAMRYLCIALPKTKDGLTKDDIDRHFNEARYGSSKPSFFDNSYR